MSPGYVKIYPINEIPEAIVVQIRKDDVLTTTNDIYGQQIFHIEEANDESYFVAAFDDNDVYLGGVILFLKEGATGVNPNPPVFQGITKSSYGFTSKIKLNSLVIPAIVNFLKDRGYSEVRTEPYDNQRQILGRHYGFEAEFFGAMVLKF